MTRPFEIDLRTSDHRVQALVEPWLRESRLTIRRPLTLDIRVGTPATSADDQRAIFHQGNVEIRSASATHPLRLDWLPGLGSATIDDRLDTADVVLSEAALERANELRRSFLLNVCILLLRRAGLHHVHAATLREPGGRGWLLVGVSQSGKSTTTALLAQRGWAVGTDDIAFFDAGTKNAGSGNPANAAPVNVVAWRERLALRPDSAAAMGPAGGTEFAARRKTGWYAEELGSTWLSSVTPEVIAFPTVHADAPSEARPLRPAEVLSRLMQCSPWVALEPALADEHLAAMSRATRQARCVALNLGRDLFDRPELLLDLLPELDE